MKKKVAWLVNLATICLCVCAIVIGVYAVKTATLNVGGTVSFVAHHCKVNVSGKYSGYTAENQTTLTEEDLWSGKISVGGANESDYKVTKTGIQQVYFSDIASTNNYQSISVTLTVENDSDFPVKVTTSAPTLTNSTVAACISTQVNTTSAILQAKGSSSNTSVEIKYTFSTDFSIKDVPDIDSTNGGYNILLNFEKQADATTFSVIQSDGSTQTSFVFVEGATWKTYVEENGIAGKMSDRGNYNLFFDDDATASLGYIKLYSDGTLCYIEYGGSTYNLMLNGTTIVKSTDAIVKGGVYSCGAEVTVDV